MKSHVVSMVGAVSIAAALVLGSAAFVTAQGEHPGAALQQGHEMHGAGPEGQGPMMGGPGMQMSADFVARHFIEEMIPHHEDAVVMADLALTQAEHAELRELAVAIKQVQTDEIALMRDWYLAWFGSDPQPSSMGGMGMGQGMGADMGSHDPTAIDGAVPFDKAFIEEMIPHHQMAVMMSTMALRQVDRPELRGLLQSIIESQSTEIARMRAWYQGWYGTPPLSSSHGMQRGITPQPYSQMMPASSMGADHQVGPGHSPYAAGFDAQARVRGLSPDEMQQIRAGEGAGFARAAELNGLPGPRHVLDLAAELGLSREQHDQIQAVYEGMRAEAMGVGQQYLSSHENLEQDLRARRLTTGGLAARHADVAALRAELELIHLRAHLMTADLLTEDQVTTYNRLRGYVTAP
jgi:uncharacterized protein (DUF305 family)